MSNKEKGVRFIDIMPEIDFRALDKDKKYDGFTVTITPVEGFEIVDCSSADNSHSRTFIIQRKQETPRGSRIDV